MSSVYVGVDPAFRKGGFWACVIDMTDKTVAFREFADVLQWHDWIRSPDAPEECFVCVENSNMQDVTFAYGMVGNKSQVARTSRNVGANQAVSELTYRSAVARYGSHRVFQVSPEQKGRKYSPDQFAAVIRHDGVLLPKGGNNQDQRDAYKLAAIARQKAIMNRSLNR